MRLHIFVALLIGCAEPAGAQALRPYLLATEGDDSSYDAELRLPPGLRTRDPRAPRTMDIPPLPSGETYLQNVQEIWGLQARYRLDLERSRTLQVVQTIVEPFDRADAEWLKRVAWSGAWDYKKVDFKKYEHSGNFNFGATGAVTSFSHNELRFGAGLASIRTNGIANGLRWYSADMRYFGDDPRDGARVDDGFWYTKTGRVVVDGVRQRRLARASERAQITPDKPEQTFRSSGADRHGLKPFLEIRTSMDSTTNHKSKEQKSKLSAEERTSVERERRDKADRIKEKACVDLPRGSSFEFEDMESGLVGTGFCY